MKSKIVVSLSMLALTTSVFSHGYVTVSRQALCKAGLNSGCGSVIYEPQSVEGLDGWPGAAGPKDGTVAAGGMARFSSLNAQSPNRWKKTKINSGPYTFEWKFTAKHQTADYKYYITKPGWNPSKPLARRSFELTPFCTAPGGWPGVEKHTCTIPNRTGYHVVVAVWNVGNTRMSFYSAIDLNITAPTGEPSVDTVKPILKLKGKRDITLYIGDTYTEQGATVTDNVDKDITYKIKGSVNPKKEGRYVLTYSATDRANNTTTIKRFVLVKSKKVIPPPIDTVKPILKLKGKKYITLYVGDTYTEQGATVTDNVDKDITYKIKGSVNPKKEGRYVLTYSATDRANNTTTIKRFVLVKIKKVTPPTTSQRMYKLRGNKTITINVGDDYKDPGIDILQKGIEVAVTTDFFNLNTKKVGTYKVTYRGVNQHNEVLVLTRTVVVKERSGTPPPTEVDTVAPVIKYKKLITLKVGDKFRPSTVMVTDNVDGRISNYSASSNVNTKKPGTYWVKYTASDKAGNETTVKQIVIVKPLSKASKDTVKPVITLNGNRTVTIKVGDKYQDAGAHVTDNIDYQVKLKRKDNVNINKAGRYTVTYTATDHAGNIAIMKRIVIVIKNISPPVKSTKTVVDVLVLYAKRVTSMYKGKPQVRINHLIAVANNSFKDSGLDVSLKVVKMQEHNSVGGYTNHFANLSNVRRNLNVRKLRDDLKADIVISLSPYSYDGKCGVAPLLTNTDNRDRMKSMMYTHVTINCGNKPLVHEVGHLMGLGHSHKQHSVGIFPYATGYGVQNKFATIMAYGSSFRARKNVMKFSSPKLKCLQDIPCGIEIGKPGEADAVETLKFTAPIVSKLN